MVPPDDASVSVTEPGAHTAHATVDTALYCPAAHAVHCTAPVPFSVFVTDPEPHDEQPVCLLLLW